MRPTSGGGEQGRWEVGDGRRAEAAEVPRAHSHDWRTRTGSVSLLCPPSSTYRTPGAVTPTVTITCCCSCQCLGRSFDPVSTFHLPHTCHESDDSAGLSLLDITAFCHRHCPDEALERVIQCLLYWLTRSQLYALQLG